MWLRQRDSKDELEVIAYVSPEKEVNAGLWTLFVGATILLSLRIWVKFTRRHGVWWDDYILLASWCVLAATNSLISYEYATGYVTENGAKWDDRMHIFINITSCGTLIGQAWSKTAFAVTLLKLTERWQKSILWLCIFIMNGYMITKVIFQWAKVCKEKDYDVWYRLDFCINPTFRDNFKEGGNITNVFMDFFFAAIPWYLTWNLAMRRIEKIGLCLTMSMGVIVAIVAAVRISWKDEGNTRDPLYYWRNGLSNVWYSSEVAGTIIVQCVPVLRPFLRDIHNSFTSKRIPSTAGGNHSGRKSFTWAVTNQAKDNKQFPLWSESSYSTTLNDGFTYGFNETKITSGGIIELRTIEEERHLEKRDEAKSIRSHLTSS